MKTVQKITNYTFLKTCEGRKDYSFIRVQVDGLDRFTWIMGKENENGLISSVGYINDELQNSLEKEYQEKLNYIDSPEFFLQSILDKLDIKFSSNFPDKMFYCIDNKIYFEVVKNKLKIKKGYTFCRYEDLYEVLIKKYLLTHNETTTIIENMLSKHLSCKVDGVISYPENYAKKMENGF